jgi:hypothetical protein
VPGRPKRRNGPAPSPASTPPVLADWILRVKRLRAASISESPCLGGLVSTVRAQSKAGWMLSRAYPRQASESDPAAAATGTPATKALAEQVNTRMGNTDQERRTNPPRAPSDFGIRPGASMGKKQQVVNRLFASTAQPPQRQWVFPPKRPQSGKLSARSKGMLRK